MTEVAEERMLLHELNHRINNEFAAAISVVSFAARRSNNDEVKAALSASCRNCSTNMRMSIVRCRCQSATRWLMQPHIFANFAVRLRDPCLKRGKSVSSWQLSPCVCRPTIVGAWE